MGFQHQQEKGKRPTPPDLSAKKREFFDTKKTVPTKPKTTAKDRKTMEQDRKLDVKEGKQR